MKKVKNIVAVLCAAVVFVLAGCSKDSDDKNYEELIVGKWNAEKAVVTISGTGNPEVDGTETETFEAGEAIMVFGSDHTFAMSHKDETSGEMETETGTYTISGSKLTLVPSDVEEENAEMNIESIDSKSMELSNVVSLSGATMQTNMFLTKE